jgi:hypothetical protein
LKIAFDENVPVQMVRVFTALGQEKRFRGFEFVSARDYAPKYDDPDYIKKSDVPWLERFAQDGGKVVISGNTRMMEVPLEMQALRQLGFLVFFFENKWNGWDFYKKSALVLFYWNLIASKCKRGKRGKFWRIPNHFREDAELKDCSPGKKKIRKVVARTVPKTKSDGADGIPPSVPKKRPRRPSNPNQTVMMLTGGGTR